MSVQFNCNKCGRYLKNTTYLPQEKCKCGSTDIRKQEGSDREWLNWYYQKVKGKKK